MLDRLKKLEQPIRVAIIGVGAMGKGLFYQLSITPGMECVVIADIDIDKCVQVAQWLNVQHRVVDTQNKLNDTIRTGYLGICADGNMAAQAACVDVVIEASNAIGAAAQYALAALEHQRHLVLMNAEIDAIFGPYLMQLAHKNGVTYASCDGDQHGVIRKLYDEMVLWGFKPIMAGNIKGFLDRYSNPTKIIPEADKRNLDYKMCTAYTDGTKLNIEMSLVANALDMRTHIKGMHGPRASHVQEVLDLYDLDELYALEKPVVDYILGAQPGGGVFTIGHCDKPYQMDMMQYYKMGPGPFYVFYRPYHLCHVEAMEYVARAALDQQSLLEPTYGFQTNVYAHAKKPLCAGETLDGIGGYATYGLIENCPTDSEDNGLPICLAEHVVLRNPIEKDQKISLSDIEFDAASIEFDLYFKSLNLGKKLLTA